MRLGWKIASVIKSFLTNTKSVNKLTHYTTDKIFKRLLKNKSEKNYWNYISELRKRKTEDIFQRSISLTKSELLQERILGVDLIAQFGYPRLHKKKILSTLFELLKQETDKTIIYSILYAIGHNNESLTKKQVELLCSFKTHKSVVVKRSLVSALCTVKNEKAIETLIELSIDREPEIRDWATFAIGSQIDTDNEIVRAALWNRISDKDEGTRFEAIAGLAQRKDERIKDVLIAELENIDEYGSLILESIEELNDKSFIPYIKTQIEKNKVSNSINEEWLISTLNVLQSSETK